jgi:hypothetical protein
MGHFHGYVKSPDGISEEFSRLSFYSSSWSGIHVEKTAGSKVRFETYHGLHPHKTIGKP